MGSYILNSESSPLKLLSPNYSPCQNLPITSRGGHCGLYSVNPQALPCGVNCKYPWYTESRYRTRFLINRMNLFKWSVSQYFNRTAWPRRIFSREFTRGTNYLHQSGLKYLFSD